MYAAALAAALVIGPRGPVYWDSFGYVAQAVSGQVGGLGLGRPVFVLVSHSVAWMVRGVGGSLLSLEPALRTAWLAVSALSAPLAYALARRVGLGPRGALFAGLAMAMAPAMAHTSAAVLTDAPSVAATLLAFVLAARAVQSDDTPAPRDGARATAPDATSPPDAPATASDDASAAPPSGGRPRTYTAFAAGAALGLAIGLREQAVVQLATLALMLPCAPRGLRVRLGLAMLAGAVLFALAPVAYVDLTQQGYRGTVRAWLEAMRREREAHPYQPRDLLVYAFWLAAMGPPVLLAALVAWARYARDLAPWRTVRAAVAVPALAQLVLLAGYQDISFSPRYLLPALCGAIVIPAAYAFEHFTAPEASHPRARLALVLAAIVLPGLLAAPGIHRRERPLLATLGRLPVALAQLPPDAVIVTGQLCPAVDMLRRLTRAERGANAPAWQTVCPGWSWPADLTARLDRARAEGRTVVLDLRESSWIGPRQRAARDQAAAWYRARRADASGVVVWTTP